MITNAVQKARLDVDVALDALYPIIHIVTDDYGKVEQIMERCFFARSQWDSSANAYTKGEASCEYIRLLPEMSETDLMRLTTGAGVSQKLLDDLSGLEEMARKLLCLCQDELPVNSVQEQAIGQIQEKIKQFQEKTEEMCSCHGVRKVVFYARGDSSRADGTFSEKTITLMERYVEVKTRAMNRHPRKDKRIPDEWPDSSMVIYGCDTVIPRSVEQYVCRVEIKPLDEQDFASILSGFGVAQADIVKWYADWLAGFTESEVFSILREIEARGEAGAVRLFNGWPKKIIEKKKRERIKKHGKLVYKETDGATLPDNMKNIKEWLDEHRTSIRDNSSRKSDEITKGMLLVGIPGTGKSLVAKSVAKELKLPLYQLQMSSVLGKYVGESDKNMDQVLEDVKNAAPLVLWIDEIEKALAGSDGSDNSGVMQRLFGQLLTFMQEMNRTVFIVATANDMSRFPPEFTRNGRFDVRFCMPMPDFDECVSIMKEKLNDFLGCGEDERLARFLFKICSGVEDDCHCRPRFLTGADINAVVKELKVIRGGCRINRPVRDDEYERFGEDMKLAVQAVSMTGETKNPQTIRDIARCYRGMLEMSAMMTGKGEPLLSADRYFPERIMLVDHSVGEKYQSCMDRPTDYEKRPLYDRRLFDTVVAQLDLLLAQDLKHDDYEQYRFFMNKYRKMHMSGTIG